jgi:hypothetical protein
MRRWLALAVVLFAIHRALTPMRETDLFFHLKIGQLILADHAIPFRNLFSFTYPNAPDPDLAWGFQVLAALAFRVGGFPAIVLLKTLLFAAAMALTLWLCRRVGAGPLASAAAAALAICAADQRLVERPHLVTFVGIPLVAILYERRAWRFIPLVVLGWANFHAGVFLAIVFLVASAIGERLDGERPVIWFIPLAALMTFFTPAGTRLPSYLLWHTGLGATRIVEEFRHADLYDDPWFFGMLTLALASAFAVRSWRRTLPVLMVAILALRSVRFVAEWAILAAPLCALGLTRMSESIGWRPRQWAGAMILLVVISAERRSFEIGLGEDVVPFAAIDFIEREGLKERLYENLDVGCYLLFRGWKVFQDARLPAYPDEFHRALDQTPLEPAAFDALLGRYGVDAALINDPDIDMRAGSFDPDEWALVWKSSDALVFARRSDKFRDLIARKEIPLRPRFAFVGGTRYEPITRPPARSPIASCEWHRRLVRSLADLDQPDRAFEARLEAFRAGCLDDSERDELRAYVLRAERARR